MRVQVNMDRCQHYGQCVFEAPSNFALNDEDLLEYEAEIDDTNLEDVRSAKAVCPVQAIALIE